MDGWKEGRKEGWMDGLIGGWVGGWMDEIFVYVTVFLIQPLWQPYSVFVDGACCVQFCCRYSRVLDMNFMSPCY